PSLDAVTSMDQLLQLLYPEYSLLQNCMRKKSWHSKHLDSNCKQTKSSYSIVFPVILEEIHRTSCQPREVCIEVAKEYPESTSQVYIPRCVALHRCGGCCGNEAFYCTNTSYTLVNKTLMELSPPRMDRSVAMVTFINHTSCECLSKRPLHSVIRRAAADHLTHCLWGMNKENYRISLPLSSTEALDSRLLALCGPNRVLEESSCECVCQNGLTEASCDPGWKLDQNTCECQCEGQGEGRPCPAGQRWDDDLCGCVCAVKCPRNQPLNPETCLCQCRESPQTCLRQGKKFNPKTCSCYRPPCKHTRRACQDGFYYSYHVCQCIPKYMRWN
uniref:Platelet-derived growth factor (PDGF) family profile domain-containing protein n=1 Tax=Nothobranchius furzeri TaxID=105023 RepID=A0A8C6Q6E6_NOTFU